MFKKVVLMCAFLMFVSVPVMAEEPATELKVVLDQDLLMALGSNTRNLVLNAVQEEANKGKGVKPATVEKTIEVMSGVSVDEFKSKAGVIADTINIFCQKIGVTVNDFITTPAGNFIIFGALWKLGVFGSIWGFFKGFGIIGVLLWLLIALNSRKIIKLNSYNDTGEVYHTEEKLVPRLTAIFEENKEEQTCFALVGSAIILILLVIATCVVL